MKDILLLKHDEKFILESPTVYISEDNNRKGFLYLTTQKLLYISNNSIIEFYVPIHNIIGVFSTGFLSKFLIIQYLTGKDQISQATFKVKKAKNWVKEIHATITSPK